MKNAVVYARFSSHRQGEQSIDGQLSAAYKYARENDYQIIHEYIDRAMTGRNDNREQFQKMLKDTGKRQFETIILWKIDRFGRNREEIAFNKYRCKKNGVNIVRVAENIPDSAEGVILDSVLEGMAEYYSLQLAQNVTRGMTQKATQGKYLGGTVPLGYIINENKDYVLDENGAVIVKKIFQMYANGETIKTICYELNTSGYKTSTGKAFTYNSLHRILTNKKYIGIYEYFNISINDAIPRIIDDETFYKVQKRMEENKRAPARAKSDVKFLLSGKLFCGKCGNNMVGDSGTSKTGVTHYYYSCIEKKLRHGCTKKSVRKEWIEEVITDIIVKQILTEENIEYISKKSYELYQKEITDTSELTALNNMLKDTQKVIDNIMKAIEQGIITETTKQRLMEAEEQKRTIQLSIAQEEVVRPIITEEHIKFFLQDIKNRVYKSNDKLEVLINAFVNAVYLYDDKITITFNLHEGEDLKKLELTELEKFEFDNKRFTITKSTLKGCFCYFLFMH